MYNFKVINMCIPDKTFNQLCFLSVSDAKFKLKDTLPIPTELRDGIFCCNGTGNQNLEVMSSLKVHFKRKNFIEGIDYTINILIEN